MIGGRGRTLHPARQHPGAEAAGGHVGHPIAPTEFPKGRSAAGGTGSPVRAAPARCDMRPSGGGYQLPVTPGDGYRIRLTPKCLWITIAIGQPSTDSLGAHGENSPRVFGYPPASVSIRLGSQGSVPQRSGSPSPPGPEPAEAKGPAVCINSAPGE